MSLLDSQTGIEILNRMACFLGKRRMSRHLKRSFWIAFDGWKQTGYFDKSVFLNELNMLNQDEIASLNQFLGEELLCLDATQKTKNIYVDSVNGSDLTGNGSTDHPYASMAFLVNFPKEINHNVRVILLEDLDMGEDPLNINFTVGPDGCFSLIGRGAPTVVNTSAGAGPFTCTAVTNYGAAPASDYGHYMTFADTWGVDELRGKWIRFDSGACEDEAFQIHGNTAHDIYFRGGCKGDPAINDTVSIIEPTITLKCQRINLEVIGPSNYSINYDACRLNIMNLNIDIRGSYVDSYQFILKSTVESQISFVTIITNDSNHHEVVLRSNLNQYLSADDNITTYTETALDNIDLSVASCCGIQMYNPDSITPTSISLVIENADAIRCIDTREEAYIIGNVRSLIMCCMGLVNGTDSPVCVFSRNMVDGDASYHSFYFDNCGTWRISNVVLTTNGQNIFYCKTVNLWIDLSTLSFAGSTFTGFAFYYHFQGNNRILVNTSTAAIAAATANDIHFAGGVGTVAFPGADAMVTDALGNTFSYISTP